MAFPGLSALPIAQLSASTNASETYLHGIVTLIWPYSSIAHTFSFLLAEPDFRLRRQKGQVRISLRGAAARRVARRGIASGDEIKLRLASAEVARDRAEDQTPGRSCGWEVIFEKSLELEVRTAALVDVGTTANGEQRVRSGTESVYLDTGRMSASPEPRPVLELDLASRTPPETPNGTRFGNDVPYTPRNGFLSGFMKSNVTFDSPAFLKSKGVPAILPFTRASNLFLEDEDGWIEGPPSKKVKFGRKSDQWRFVERTPSPEKEVPEDTAEGEVMDVVVVQEAARQEETGEVQRAEEVKKTADIARNAATGEAPVTVHANEMLEQIEIDVDAAPSAQVNPLQVEEASGSERRVAEAPPSTPSAQLVENDAVLDNESQDVSPSRRPLANTIRETGDDDIKEIEDTAAQIMRFAHTIQETGYQPDDLIDYEGIASAALFEEALSSPQGSRAGNADDDDIPENIHLGREHRSASAETELLPEFVTQEISAADSLPVPSTEDLEEQMMDDAQPRDTPRPLTSSPRLESSPLLRTNDFASFRQSPGLQIDVQAATPRPIDDGNITTPDTPRLQPRPSPGLNMVSPLEQTSHAAYFDPNGSNLAQEAPVKLEAQTTAQDEQFEESKTVVQETIGILSAPASEIQEEIPPDPNTDEELQTATPLATTVNVSLHTVTSREDVDTSSSEPQVDAMDIDEGTRFPELQSRVVEDLLQAPEDDNASEKAVDTRKQGRQAAQDELFTQNSTEVAYPRFRNGSPSTESTIAHTQQSELPINESFSAQIGFPVGGSLSIPIADLGSSERWDILFNRMVAYHNEQSDQPAHMAIPIEGFAPTHAAHEDHGIVGDEQQVLGPESLSAVPPAPDFEPQLRRGPEDTEMNDGMEMKLNEQQQGVGNEPNEESQPFQTQISSLESSFFKTQQPSTVEIITLASDTYSSSPAPEMENSVIQTHDEAEDTRIPINDSVVPSQSQKHQQSSAETVALPVEKEASSLTQSKVDEDDEDDEMDTAWPDQLPSKNQKQAQAIAGEVQVDEDTELVAKSSEKESIHSQEASQSKVDEDEGDDEMDMAWPDQLPLNNQKQAPTIVGRVQTDEGAGLITKSAEKESIHSQEASQFEEKEEIESEAEDAEGETESEDEQQTFHTARSRGNLTQFPHTPDDSQLTGTESTKTLVELPHPDPKLPTPRLTQVSFELPKEIQESPQRITRARAAQLSQNSTESQNSPARKRGSKSPQASPQSPDTASSEDSLNDKRGTRSSRAVSKQSPDTTSSLNSIVKKRVTRSSQAASEHSQETSSQNSVLGRSSQKKTAMQKESLKETVGPLPQAKGFTTGRGYYAPLSTLSEHFNNLVSVLALVADGTNPTKAKSGPKDFNQTIYLSDPSSSSQAYPLTTAAIFRPNSKALPCPQSGDVLLLRDFKVQSQKGRMSLLSTGESAWATFRLPKSQVAGKSKDTGKNDMEVNIRGPPAELGAEERGFARGLGEWWASLDEGLKKKIETTATEVRHKAEAQAAKDAAKAEKASQAQRRSTRNDPTSSQLEDDVDSTSKPASKQGAKTESKSDKSEPRSKKNDQDSKTAAKDKTPKSSPKSKRKAKPIDLFRSFSQTPSQVSPATPRRPRSSGGHELRNGKQYSDGEGGEAEDDPNQWHELRDGTMWTDEAS